MLTAAVAGGVLLLRRNPAAPEASDCHTAEYVADRDHHAGRAAGTGRPDLVATEDGELVGHGRSIPFVFLTRIGRSYRMGGWDQVLVWGFADHCGGRQATVSSALEIVVRPTHPRGRAPVDPWREVLVPKALVPVHCSVAHNHAVYVESNVWVQHDQ